MNSTGIPVFIQDNAKKLVDSYKFYIPKNVKYINK